MKMNFNTIGSRIKKAPKVYRLLAFLLLAAIMLGVIAAAKGSNEKVETTYRETSVVYGNLVVGIEESGAVDIGIVEQSFELDMSALKRVETSNSGSSGSGSMGGSSMGGGAPMSNAAGMISGMNVGGGGGTSSFSQIFNMGGSSLATTGEDSQLEIAEVRVSVGQQIEAGDVLYILVDEGVEELAAELESNVSKAKADLEALIADQELSKVTAENTYQISLAYGALAEAEKDASLAELNQNVKDSEEALQEAKDNLTTVKKQLEEVTFDLNLAKEVLDSAVWGRDHADKSDVLTYTNQFEVAKQAQSNYDSLEQEKEQLESSLKQAESNLENYEAKLSSAKRSLEAGKLSAEQTFELRMLAYESAQETYDVTLAYLEDDLKAQEEIYSDAEKKWEEFASHIDGNQVRSKYRGVITSVDLEAGDALTTGTVLAQLYDMDEVSMTVTLEEEDMTHIEEGGLANITFTAYPDEIYKAVITEISDATSNSGSTTYEVTATLEGDVSALFQGMTGKITFITKETEEVKYVSNRAIIREGNKSYVKVKEKDGDIKKVKVVTGFSDGVNVEIVEGLEVGDVVLIESKVSE